ncbi:MAG: RidA family protein [Actinomycetota bacterium]|nr:RidA family protein [Actinomycetota bacterium]
MGRIEERITALGLQLPPEPKVPVGIAVPFQWVRVRGQRAFVSGHGALTAEGAPSGPFGRVPTEVALEDAQASARAAALAMLASLQRAVGDLDRVTGWLTVSGFVNAEPGYPQTTLVLNPVSELLLDLFGDEAGGHARTAPGVTALPLNLPVVVSAEVEIAA